VLDTLVVGQLQLVSGYLHELGRDRLQIGSRPAQIADRERTRFFVAECKREALRVEKAPSAK
jgi:hypothetical protein